MYTRQLLNEDITEFEKKNEPTALKVILHQHEKLTFSRKENSVVKDQSAIHQKENSSVISVGVLFPGIAETEIVETSWLYNELIFDGDEFSELAQKMGRWFDMRIVNREWWVICS